MPDAKPEEVSAHAKNRQRDEMGTLGSGNHYLEVQRVARIFSIRTSPQSSSSTTMTSSSASTAESRGLGHQIGTEFLERMVLAAPTYGIELPDRELACAPIRSPVGEAYLGAMRAAINCALANREIITHLVRRALADIAPKSELTLLYDVSHNTCKVDAHQVDGQSKRLFVHRKGATRAFAPGHADLLAAFQPIGQPVLIGGTMGTASYVLVGTSEGEKRSFGSSCHGAGRSMSRHAAVKQWQGRQLMRELADQWNYSSGVRRREAWPRKRRAPTRTSRPLLMRQTRPDCRKRSRASSRLCASKDEK